MFNNWPYTNLNELNLDWILEQVKGISDKYKDLDSASAAGVEAVQQQEQTSLQDLDNMKMTIVTAINGARDIALVDVNATKTNALNDITTAQGTAESAIAADKTAAQTAIETDKTNALTAIAALGNSWDAHYESLIAEMPADLASITQTLAILGRILTGESEQTVTFFMGDYAGGSKTSPTPAATSDVSTEMIIGGAGFKFKFTLDDNVDTDTKIYAIRWFEGKNASTGVYTGEHIVSCGNVRHYYWTVPDTCYSFSITLRNSETSFTEAPASDIATLRWYTTISDFVSVDGDQDFTEVQKAQGRENIGAASEEDYAELEDEVTELKSALSSETGRTFITMVPNKALNLNVNSIDFTDIPYVTRNGTNCAVVSCNRGDVFTVTAEGYGNYRAWGFFNSDGSKNTIAASGVSATKEVLTAPENGYLCINDANGGSESFYGKYVCKDIIDLKNKAKDIQLLKVIKIQANPGKNLFNPNASGIVQNKYINDRGNEATGTIAFISDYIPVEEGASYAISGCVASGSGIKAAFYDADLIVISIVPATDGVQTAPSGAKYLRVSIANTYIGTAQVEKASSASAYEKYHDTIMAEIALIVKPFSTSSTYSKGDLTNYNGLIYKANSDITAGSFDPTKWTKQVDFYTGIKQSSSSSDPNAIHLSKNGLKTKGTSLSANTEIDLGKANIAKNVIYELCAKFSSFDSIKIGHGEDSTKYASWVVITGSQITVYEEVGDGNPRTSTYTHGLTISDFLNVQIVTTDDYKCNVKIQTKKAENESGHYETDTAAKFYGNCDGHYYFKPTMAVTEYSFDVIFIDATKPIYLIGDSYMSFDYSTTPSSLRDRWVEYLKDVDQFNNVLINACGGLNTTRALNALDNLKGEPKFALWAIGMNDTADVGTTANSAWVSGVETFIAWCEERNCTPILATIPTVPSKNNAGKNAYVRSSGYRYVDMAAAVSASDNGTWYPDMLGTDNVHPTEEGARAMFHRAIAEFPEIMSRL